ncbi:MAG: LPS assembly protein LptD [Acidobacteria bacterium]|nr:LPS assembly protein LptD [Acidobacteriota bacterium]
MIPALRRAGLLLALSPWVFAGLAGAQDAPPPATEEATAIAATDAATADGSEAAVDSGSETATAAGAESDGLSDPVSSAVDENPAAQLGTGTAAPLDAPETTSEVPLEKPVDKPVSEMTPEERKAFRLWRQAQLAETMPPPLDNTPPEDAVTFDLTFPASQGGGSADGWAGSMSYREDELAELSGGVVIRYQEIEIRADRIDVDVAGKLVRAYGDVILDQGPRRLSGTTLTFDLSTKTGSITDANAFMSPDFYFTGEEVKKTGEDTYEVVDGVFTSCRDETPDWSFKLGKAKIKVDGYAKVKNASMRIKKAPVLYFPYILWPVKSGRTSGFLVPNVGYSDRRGALLGLAYYQVLGPSYDTTFFADIYTKDYLGFGNEFRYRPSEGTKGRFQGYVIRDPATDQTEWKLDLDHETTDLPFGMRGVVTAREFSDFDFFRDFERSVDKSTVRSLESRGFISGNWGSHSVNILFSKRETFLNNGNTVKLRRLPELEYRLRPLRLGSSPFFLKMDSSLSYLSADRTETVSGSYGRVDLAPQLTLPLRLVPWLNVSLSAGYRYTWWSDSLRSVPLGTEPGDSQTVFDEFSGDTLSRDFAFGSAEIVGPSFSRIFDKKGGHFSKLKHVIEPRFSYVYVGETDPNLQEVTPIFDEVDTVASANVGRVALVNRLLAKQRSEDGEDGAAREIMSFEISRLYSLDDTALQASQDGTQSDRAGELVSLLRLNPSALTSLTARVDYSTLFSQISSSSLSGAVGFGSNRLGLSWRTRWQPETGERLSDQVRLTGGLQLVPRRLGLQTDIVYDIEQSLVQQQRYILDYRSQCYSLRFEVRDVLLNNEHSQDYRFSVNLKNVGTFLDLTN